MTDYSIVEYLGESSKDRCGYCKTENGSNSCGFWAHTLTVHDYQALINRNWRRSGQYCYLPKNKDTCCPAYTIRCDVSDFKLNKSHKKILKRIRKFLKDGIKEKYCGNQHDGQGSTDLAAKSSQEHTDVDLDGINFTSIQNVSVAMAHPKVTLEKKVEAKSSTQSVTSNASSERPSNPKKAKLIRLERKKEKLAAKGLTLSDIKPKMPENVEKTIEDFLSEEPIDGKHQLKVKLVPSQDGSNNTILKLYQRYQVIVHHDPPEKITQRSYERFLVKTPLKIKLVSVSAAESSNINFSFNLFCKYESAIHKATHEFTDYVQFLVVSPLQFLKNNESPSTGYGSFHQQYYLDDKLIAVGVIDILPECISSVYFYYDPDYSFLSLGTYASLREIALARELSKHCPQLHNYYLGFYIPTCPKMRYKANVRPSYLLCPEVYTWHLLDARLSAEVDAEKYKRMNTEQDDIDKVTKDDLTNCLVLVNRTAMKYGDFKRMASLPRRLRDDRDEMFEYATKVGKSLSQKMLVYRM